MNHFLSFVDEYFEKNDDEQQINERCHNHSRIYGFVSSICSVVVLGNSMSQHHGQ